MQLTGGLGLAMGSAPQPRPGAGELLIRVYAAGVIATELTWYAATIPVLPTLRWIRGVIATELTWYAAKHMKTGEPRVGAVPCHEFCGAIAGAGRDVGSVETGQEVYGMNDWFAEGALADYCVAPYDAVATKPSRLTYTEAASVPISALTAWQGLLDRAKLQPGERVLVHGGAGAVGMFAIQLARLRGACVFATASAGNLDFIARLGAEQAIDYWTTPFETVARGMDVVFDTVGGETLERSWGVLNPRGQVVTIVSQPADRAAISDARVKEAFFIVEPSREQLIEVGKLLDSGQIKTAVDSVIPLPKAAGAFDGKRARTGRGKVVIEVASPVVRTRKENYEHTYAPGCKEGEGQHV